MATRIVQIIVAKEESAHLNSIIKSCEIIDSWSTLDFSQNKLIFSILISLENSQSFLDKLQSKISKSSIKKIIVSNVEALIPKEEQAPQKIHPKFRIVSEAQRVPREELYHQLSNDSKLNLDFVFLILLSTIVAALGLLHNQVIAVIAAMVIAPMLEPNLAIAFSVVLGDLKLFLTSLKTNVVGILNCFILSIVIGYIWPYGIHTAELLLKRTHVDYTSIVLALASGTAGAISLTSRFSSVLVGVMVAAALVPPLVTTGVLLGMGYGHESLGAGLLFIVNIVCINLTANLVFLFKGIHPQLWYEKEKAKKAIFWYLSFWALSLIALCIIIYFHRNLYMNS